MSGFLVNRDTSNPAGGIDPAQSPNVGQYGWTSADAAHVNQLIQYVNQCKVFAEQTQTSANYVDSIYQEIINGTYVGVLSVNTKKGEVVLKAEDIEDKNGETLQSLFDRMPLEMINVVSCGAAGDGFTNDSASFQLAIDKSAGITPIFIPAKRYVLRDKLYIPSDTRFIFQGGVYLDCFVGGSVFAYKNHLTNTLGVYNQAKNIAFVSIGGSSTINLNGLPTGQGRGFFSPTHSDGFLVENLIFLNGSQTHIFEFNSCKNVFVNNCQFIGNYPIDYTGIYGYEAIQIDYSNQGGAPQGPPWDGTPCNNIVIQNCHFENCHSGLGSHAVNTDRTKPHTDVRFLNNTIKNCYQPIKCTDFTDSIVSGNLIYGAFQRGILIDSCNNLLVEGNMVRWEKTNESILPSSWNGNSTGITINNYVPNAVTSYDVSIKDNTFYCDSFDDSLLFRLNNAVYIKNATNTSISGNTIKDTFSAGIYLDENSNSTSIQSNSMYGVGRGTSSALVYAGITSSALSVQANMFVGIPQNYIIDIRAQGGDVRLNSNTFHTDIPRNKIYNPAMYTMQGLSINDMEYIGGSVGLNATVTLPRDVSLYTSLYIGAGNVTGNGYTTIEAFPFDLANGFRVGDYVRFPHNSGGFVTVTITDLRTLTITEVPTTGIVRTIQGKRA